MCVGLSLSWVCPLRCHSMLPDAVLSRSQSCSVVFCVVLASYSCWDLQSLIVVFKLWFDVICLWCWWSLVFSRFYLHLGIGSTDSCYYALVGVQSIVMNPSVCLSVFEHISGTAGPIFMKFCVRRACGRGSVLLWRRCATLCTSGFMDDVTFGRSGPYHHAQT